MHRDLSRGFAALRFSAKIDPHLIARFAGSEGFGTGPSPTLMSTFHKVVKADLQPYRELAASDQQQLPPRA